MAEVRISVGSRGWRVTKMSPGSLGEGAPGRETPWGGSPEGHETGKRALGRKTAIHLVPLSSCFGLTQI